MSLRTLLTLLFVNLITVEFFAQDPQFTQFYANPLYLNPAFAGTARCPRITMNYRNQWTAMSGRFETYSFGADMHVSSMAGGLGILVTADNQAISTLKTTNVSLIYSYLLPVNREFSLKFGMQATYFQKVLARDNLTYGDMIDPRRGFVYNTMEPLPSNRKVNSDFSVGVLGYSKKYFVGLAANHITQPDEGLLGVSKMPVKFTAHGGLIIPLEKGNESYVSPNILFQHQQSADQLNLGLYYVKGPFVAGFWYRNQDAVIALIGLQTSNFKFGYSYDITTSKLTGSTGGSHEISVQIQFDCKPKSRRYRVISCPSF